MSTPTTAAMMETTEYLPETGWSRPLARGLNSTSTLVCAFAAPGYLEDARPLDELSAAFSDSRIIGCSTSGEVLESRVRDGSIAVAAFRFARSRVSAASAPVRDAGDSQRAGRLIAEQLNGKDLRAVFVLSDGLNVNGSELVRGINEVLPAEVVVSGGLAGDGTAFKRTWVIHNGRAQTHTVTAVGLYGTSIEVGHGSRGGWDTFGPARRVTKSEGNVLYELDGLPALDLYKRYLAERSAQLPSSALLFPLRISPPGKADVQLVRTVLAVDEGRQTMTFAGDIPQGSTAQLMRANFDRIISAAGESSTHARAKRDGASDAPALSIAISCVGRRLILGERTEEELEAAHQALGPNDRQIGFYSYGELSPFANGRCDLHNQTMTVTTIRER